VHPPTVVPSKQFRKAGLAGSPDPDATPEVLDAPQTAATVPPWAENSLLQNPFPPTNDDPYDESAASRLW
jgi:hypothetical protein